MPTFPHYVAGFKISSGPESSGKASGYQLPDSGLLDSPLCFTTGRERKLLEAMWPLPPLGSGTPRGWLEMDQVGDVHRGKLAPVSLASAAAGASLGTAGTPGPRPQPAAPR